MFASINHRLHSLIDEGHLCANRCAAVLHSGVAVVRYRLVSVDDTDRKPLDAWNPSRPDTSLAPGPP